MLRIVITGPESTGKSTLSAALAKHYDVPYAKEFARDYLETKMKALNIAENDKNTELYDEKDLFTMFLGQIRAEKEAVEQSIAELKPSILICDTDVLTYKIWSEEVFKQISPIMKDSIKKVMKTTDNQNVVSIYFLCSPEDVAWEYDPLRENPSDRDRLFAIYEKTLKNYKKSYFILRGSPNERLEKVLNFIKLMKEKSEHLGH